MRVVKLLVLIGLLTPVLRAGPIEDENLYVVPEPERLIHQRMDDIFAEAAKQPDIQTRLEALYAIAHFQMKQLTPTILALAKDDRPMVQLSVVHAAVTVDARDVAPSLARWIQGKGQTPEHRDLIAQSDAALAGWGYDKAKNVWLKRLADHASPSDIVRISAARALGQVFGAPTYRRPAGSPPQDVVDLLCRVTLDGDEPLAIRLACARALGQLDHAGAADVADGLAGGAMTTRLLAAYAARRPIEGVAVLQKLAADDEPAVAAAALRGLLDHQTREVLPWELLAKSSNRPDPRVRELAYQAMVYWQTTGSVEALYHHLNDPHPVNRQTITRTIMQLDQVEALRGPIRKQLMTHTDAIINRQQAYAGKWAEAEQLAILAGRLDHKPAAPRLVNWFEYPRHEVRLASVVSLRTLDVAPNRPAMVQFMGTLVEKAVKLQAEILEAERKNTTSKEMFKYKSDQSKLATEVALTLGVWREPTAHDNLALVIPKHHPVGVEARAAAIWALGRIHDGEPHPVADQLAGRLNDLNPLDPEDTSVRVQCAVAIGRMKAARHLKSLEMHNRSGEQPLEITCATRWAIMQITGKSLPEIKVDPIYLRQAFIRPLSAK